MTLPPSFHALVQRCRAGLARLAAGLAGWLGGLPPVPGGLKLWISLLSFGFLLAALAGHGRQLLQLSLDGQGWLWLLLGVGVSLLSLAANGLTLGVVLRWLGQRPRWPELVRAYLDCRPAARREHRRGESTRRSQGTLSDAGRGDEQVQGGRSRAGGR